VGRTPWSAADAAVGLLATGNMRDEGVPRGPGGPPHHSEKEFSSQASGATLVCKGRSTCAIGDGLPETGGLFRILTALATAAPAERLLVLGVARRGSHAMAVLEVPAHD
jgi:hypothetical protein